MNELSKFLATATPQQSKEFWKLYATKLAKSIQLDPTSADVKDALDIVALDGWGDSRSGRDWEWRARNWNRKGNYFYDPYNDEVLECPVDRNKIDYDTDVPIFPNLAAPILKLFRGNSAMWEEEYKANRRNTSSQRANGTAKTQQQTGTNDMTNKIKNTADKVLDTNKEATKIAAKLATGKTANTFFLKKIAAKLPWYAKIFGKKKEVVENPVAKLVTAELAKTLSVHFAPENDKLSYIADAMVQEAMVDITVNSEMLNNLINDLESMVNIPESL